MVRSGGGAWDVRIALISDIHANLIALQTVLDEIESEGIDRIICLGDVVGGGPHPHEALERLRRLRCPVVQGNVDAWSLAMKPYETSDESVWRMEAIDRWCVSRLMPGDFKYLRSFQPTVEVPLEAGRSLLCFHGSPRSNREIIGADMARAELIERLGDRRADVMAGGHTHEQMLRRLDETIIVNPGSVGLAFEYLPGGGSRNTAWAEYAVLTSEDGRLQVDFRRKPVSVEAIRTAILHSHMPHAEWWASNWQ